MRLSQGVFDGIKFFYRTGDKVIGQRIALGKFEQIETKIFLSQLKPEMVVVDVGANIGYYTLLAAKRVKKVYAFEPEKETFEILKKNVEENKLMNVILVNKAVGNENKKVGISKNKDNFGDSRIIEGEGIDCVRLDETIKEKVDLIKIDVQGYEIKVLEGAKKILKDKPIIFMELDSKNVKQFKTDYRWVWSINDFAEVSWPLWSGVQIKNSYGYVDLLMKEKMNVNDFWTMIRSVQYKKLVKGIMRSIWQK